MPRLFVRLSITLALAALPVQAGFVSIRAPRALADEVMVHMISTCNGTSCDYSFFPQTTTVPAGSAITFMNLTSVPHTATADNGAFDTGTLAAGGYIRMVFSTPGTYPFHCSVHPAMHGTIVITGGAPPPTSTSAATPSATAAPAPPAALVSTPTATPSLTLAVRLSPKSVVRGHEIRLTVRTLPLAELLVDMKHPGMGRSSLHVRAWQDGSYAKTINIGRREKPGKLTVRVTAILGVQMAQAVASASIR